MGMGILRKGFMPMSVSFQEKSRKGPSPRLGPRFESKESAAVKIELEYVKVCDYCFPALALEPQFRQGWPCAATLFEGASSGPVELSDFERQAVRPPVGNRGRGQRPAERHDAALF